MNVGQAHRSRPRGLGGAVIWGAFSYRDGMPSIKLQERPLQVYQAPPQPFHTTKTLSGRIALLPQSGLSFWSPEVIGLGKVTVMPASSHARISAVLK
jgi:hypothetical protein